MNKRFFIKSSILGVSGILFSAKAKSLEYYPAPSEKKWAVLYGTWCGSARDAAVWISEGMNGIANVFDVREKPDLSKYDNIIIGGAIRAEKTSEELQQFLISNKDLLKNKIRGYFAVCGNMMQPVGPEQTRKFIDDHIAAICGTKGLPSKVFPGRITFGLMEPDIRKQMQGMPGIKEYDNLKRSECMAFGKQLAQGS
jgi:menaquinone-dependent protoporphyrinogen IX oxidase